MDCRSDCPEVCRRVEATKGLAAKVEEMNVLSAQNENALKANSNLRVEDFIETDEKKIKWSSSLIQSFSNKIKLDFKEEGMVKSMYRPFVKEMLYFNKHLNHRPYLMPRLFPTPKTENRMICASGVGVTKDFTTIITDTIPDLELIGKSQCFPLYYYEERQKHSPEMFDEGGDSEYIRRDGVSDFILERAKKQYGKNVTKEDIFYYVYGFLHGPEYRTLFANDLKKMLPRLPITDDVKDFWAFSKAGRKLAELHINYETVPAYNGVEVTGADSGYYTVEKMRFPKKDQKDTILYNSKITISNIPAKAYEYVVNGKSAIEWIMERYQITTHKESGIKNDSNDWPLEVGNPRYILDLLLSIINVSMQTVDIVGGLPKVKFEE